MSHLIKVPYLFPHNDTPLIEPFKAEGIELKIIPYARAAIKACTSRGYPLILADMMIDFDVSYQKGVKSLDKLLTSIANHSGYEKYIELQACVIEAIRQNGVNLNTPIVIVDSYSPENPKFCWKIGLMIGAGATEYFYMCEGLKKKGLVKLVQKIVRKYVR